MIERRRVEGAHLENEAGERDDVTQKRINAYAISELALQNDFSVSVDLDVCRGFDPDISHSYHNPFSTYRFATIARAARLPGAGSVEHLHVYRSVRDHWRR